MSMTHSRNDSSGYLDGIPVKIGEKFKPPRQIVLPFNYQQRTPTSLLNDDYNFQLERQIIEWSESRRRMKEEKERANDEKVASQIEQFTRFSSNGVEKHSDSSDVSPSSGESRDSSENDSGDNAINTMSPTTTTTTASLPVSEAVIANLEKSILKPQLLDPPKTSMSNATGDRAVNQIKLEDFEAESSPFDSVELKTLNDMEELKSVLQNCVTTTITTTTTTNWNLNKTIYTETPPYLNYSNYSVRWNAPHYYNHTYTNPTTSLYGVGQQYTFQMPQQQAVTPTSDSSSTSSGSLRNARSTPDLLREIGKSTTEEIIKRNSQLVRPNSIGSVMETKQKLLSDPFDELDGPGQLLVYQMVDMGFPRSRAARAVRHLGSDDKKVVEHLCSVQCLIEKGFNPEKAETALNLNEQDQKEAEEYLNLTKQFLDLGFDEEKIEIALTRHKNDRDKSLDYLLS